MSRYVKIVAVSLLAVMLAGCTDVPTMLAGGAKGYCKHNPGTSPCTRPPPGYPQNMPR
jgi:starvation-inducible outer membrane lipoprotein